MKSTFAGLLTLSLLPFSLQAADFPLKDKPVTLVVPFAAGGPTDRVARDLAEAMRKTLGNSVVVENAAGGPGGLIGATKVTRANPDGHTLLVHHIAMGIFPSLVRNLPFKVDSDFEYLGMINDVPMTLIGKPQLPANNYKELITWVNANKGSINLANAGLASASHLCGMLWQASVQVDMTTVPYKGTAPAMTDLIGGQVDLMCDQTTNTTQQIKANTVKVYGVTSAQRVASLKEVPTLAEQGMKGFEVVVWHGFYAPKGTPKPIMDKLVAALQAAVQDAPFKTRLAELGAEPVPLAKANPDALRTHLQAEINKWAPVIKKAGIYAD